MKRILFILILAASAMAHAHEAVIQISEFDNKTGEFTLKQWGRVPTDSYVEFWNTFGCISGNRYNQIPGNHNATLTLVGWEGCVIDSVTLSMCSNNYTGNVRLTVEAGSASLFTMPTTAFNDSSWYGAWLSKDCRVYGDITKEMRPYLVRDTDEVVIHVSGGSTKGESVYLHRITIHYSTLRDTQSPLGYVYQKMEKKDVLHDLDTVFLFRSGYASGDFGGMEHGVLDAETLHSYSDVYEPWIVHFVAHQDGSIWRLTDLWSGDTLCTTGLKNLSWNTGVDTWSITTDYSGAIITSTQQNYGTICFNAAISSGPGFRTYAKSSSDCPLPFLYRRVRQNQPVAVSTISMLMERTKGLGDTIVLLPSLLPKNATEERVIWTSSLPEVASVRDGIVRLHSMGQVLITAQLVTTDQPSSNQSVLSASTLITVTDSTSIESDLEPLRSSSDATLVLLNGQFFIRRGSSLYSLTGQRMDD